MAAQLSFLFDECLTPDLVAVAYRHGFVGYHVRNLGRLGDSDRMLSLHAFEHDLALVTNNRRDFVRIYRQLELHPGLIVLLPSASIADQATLFTAALHAVEDRADLINLLVEVDETGSVTIQSLSNS